MLQILYFHSFLPKLNPVFWWKDYSLVECYFCHYDPGFNLISLVHLESSVIMLPKQMQYSTFLLLWNNQQMRQCAVKFISLQVHSTYFGRHTRPSSGVHFLSSMIIRKGDGFIEILITHIHTHNLRSIYLIFVINLIIVPMAVDTVKIVLLMMGVCAARNM